MQEKPLLQRLIQRKLVPWSVAYLALAFLLLQGLNLAQDTVGLSPLVYGGAQVLLFLGFLLTVLLAWYHGAPGPQRVTAREIFLLAAVLAAGGTAMLFLRELGRGPSLPPGVTLTSGGNTPDGRARGRRFLEGGEESLGDLVAATVPDEGDQFEASIAILPLENRTRDPALDTLASGIADDLITRLSRIRGLKVISRQSVQGLEGLSLSPAEIADTLDVDHLLMGTAFPNPQGPEVRVRLLQVAGEEELWASRFTLGETSREAAVEEIFNEVAAALVVETPTLSLETSPRATDSPGYVAYLAGSQLLNSRTRDGVIRAIDAFRTAIALDTTFALAYAGISSAYALSITYRYDIGVDAYGAAGLALKAADIAVELDEDLAEAYAARGYISSLSLAPAELVGADFGRAMDLQPNAPNVAAWYANLLIREGYYDQALAEAQRAVELDPLSSPRRTGLAYEALRARDYELAIQEARVAQTLEEDVMLPRGIQAQALLLSGRAQECLEMDLGPHDGIRAMCLHALGRRDEAREIVDSLRVAVRSGVNPAPGYTAVIQSGDLAAYFAWTGEPERALPWIHRAYALSPSGIDPRILESGLFDEMLSNRVYRREVEEIRGRIWSRVQREEVEALIGVAGWDS
jgi:TolB-like protein